MAAEVGRPLRYRSVTSFKSQSDVGDEKIHADERAKLNLLLKTWKTKYEKAQSATRQHSEYIKVLESDIVKLREEKHRIQEAAYELENERDNYERRVQQLKAERELSGDHHAGEAENLRQKLDRVRNETESTVVFYKDRDKDMERKMMVMQGTIDDLKEIIKNLKLERQEYILERASKPESGGEKIDVEKLKAKFMEQVEHVKKLCAGKIEEAKQRSKEAEERAEAAAAEFKRKKDGLEGSMKNKNGDKDMEQKMMAMQGTIDSLKEIIKDLKLQLQKYTDEDGGEKIDVEKLKAKFMAQVEHVKKLCAGKIEEAKQRSKEAEERAEAAAAEFKRKKDGLEGSMKNKNDDKDMEQKMMAMQGTIDSLKEIIKDLKLQLQKYTDEDGGEKIDVEKLKAKFMAQVEHVKKLCAGKIEEARQRSKEAEERAEAAAAEFKRKKDGLEGSMKNKNGDKDMEQKMMAMQGTIDSLKEIIKDLKLQLQKYTDEDGGEKIDVEKLKAKFMAQVEHVKKLCAGKIEEAKQRSKEAEERAEAAAAEFNRKKDGLEGSTKNKISEAKEEMEKQFNEKTGRLLDEHEKQIQALENKQSSKNIESDDKATMVDLDDPWFKEERDSLETSIREAIERLKRSRCSYYHSFFWEFDGKPHKELLPELSYTSMGELVDRLSACQQSLREIKQALSHYDQPGSDQEHFERLHLLVEVDFNTKVHEIEYIRKLIRLKRIRPSGRSPWYLGGYSSPRSSKPAPTFGKTQVYPPTKPTRKSKKLVAIVPRTLELDPPQVKSHQKKQNNPQATPRKPRQLPQVPQGTNNKTNRRSYESPYAQHRLRNTSSVNPRPPMNRNNTSRRSNQPLNAEGTQRFPLLKPRPPANNTTRTNTRTTNRKLFLPRINNIKPQESLNSRVRQDRRPNRTNSRVQLFPTVNGRQYYDNYRRGYYK